MKNVSCNFCLLTILFKYFIKKKSYFFTENIVNLFLLTLYFVNILFYFCNYFLPTLLTEKFSVKHVFFAYKNINVMQF